MRGTRTSQAPDMKEQSSVWHGGTVENVARESKTRIELNKEFYAREECIDMTILPGLV